MYWVGQDRGRVSLYREYRTVPAQGGPIRSAVAAMTRMRPLDRDYTNPWRPASRISVKQSGSRLTVDLSADAFANTNVGSELADRAIQQLVHTSTAAAADAGTPVAAVVILMDGKPADAWGSVQLGSAMRRAPMLEVQAHTWLISPQEGQKLSAGAVTFTGFGTAFEANFTWKVRSSAGAVVAQGSAMGGTGDGGFGTVTFTTTLAAGTYRVELAGSDPSDGAGGPPSRDTKTFTVT